MKVAELKAEMDVLFGQVNQRFEQVDKRFEQVDRRFEGVDQKLADLSAQIVTQAEQFRQFVTDEGEKTRRHFDVVVEQMRAERNLVLDQSNAAMLQIGLIKSSSIECERRLDDHEGRITKLEHH